MCLCQSLHILLPCNTVVHGTDWGTWAPSRKRCHEHWSHSCQDTALKDDFRVEESVALG